MVKRRKAFDHCFIIIFIDICRIFYIEDISNQAIALIIPTKIVSIIFIKWMFSSMKIISKSFGIGTNSKLMYNPYWIKNYLFLIFKFENY